MQIRVEFFGIPRQRAGTSSTVVDVSGQGMTLAELLEVLGQQFPQWRTACVLDQKLRPEYAVNIEGKRFVSDGRTHLSPGETVLIMSADAGG